LTFDHYSETASICFDLLSAYGLIGTYFVNHRVIDTQNGPSLNALLEMRESGWGIEAYSGVNMVSLLANDRLQASAKLKEIKDGFWAKGLPVRCLAPSGRMWNANLARLADGIFDFVRVGDETRDEIGRWQELPVSDPLYIRGGGTESLSNSDTFEALSARVDDLIALGGMWAPTIHRVSDDYVPQLAAYTISTSIMRSFCAKIASEVSAGRLNCVRYGAF